MRDVCSEGGAVVSSAVDYGNQYDSNLNVRMF